MGNLVDPDNGFPLSGTLPYQLGGDNGFPFAAGKRSKTCGLIDFDDFSVLEGITPNSWFLTVGGQLESISVRVELRPVHYSAQPEYWAIEVTGCTPPIVLPTKGKFIETISVAEYIGKKGIEIIGATRSEIWQRP